MRLDYIAVTVPSEREVEIFLETNNSNSKSSTLRSSPSPHKVKRSIDVFDDNGMAPLHVACRRGQLSEAQDMIRKGANINLVDGTGRTPLMYACRNVHSKLLRYLLQKGALVDTRDDRGVTALEVAVHRNHIHAIRYLLEHGADVEGIQCFDDETLLQKACRWSKARVVQLLIQFGADVNAASRGGATPLHLAVLEGNISTVQLLVRQGAAINRANDEGFTPLHVAYSSGQSDIAEFLLQNLLDKQ